MAKAEDLNLDPSQPALVQTRNFLTLYQYMCGESEIPPEFNLWCGISLLAACLQDRVWVEKEKDKKLLPNLYIFLLGPSGLGKGSSIDIALSLLKYSGAGIYTYRGYLSNKGIMDLMGKIVVDDVTGEKHIPNPKPWIIQEELSDDIGRGPIARAFLTTMTKLYTGACDIQDGTRGGGFVRIESGCVNWLAGSTEDWYHDCVTPDMLISGFGARCLNVRSNYREDVRFTRPVYPKDYRDVKDHLAARLFLLQHISGEFRFTEQAQQLEDQWYHNRKRPGDKMLWPSWKRAHDMALKLSMVLSSADGGALMVNYNHLYKAIALSGKALHTMGALVESACVTPQIKSENVIEDMLRKVKRVERTPLLKYAYKKGINADGLDNILRLLYKQDRIGFDKTPTGGKVYVWKKGGEE